MIPVQIVTEDQEFNTRDLSRHFKETWNLSKAGFDYNVVAVFGSQSTGKSTLLNHLFNTNFDIMNESARQQTTKGIWVSKAQNSNILVFDVEGTDGRERGENQDFERKSALFSLAIAEVIILNMWENAVGLYNGANLGLLKTVFEVNLQLFQKKGSPKTLLCFVIRDFTGVTPLETLANTLKIDLNTIWKSLSKPDDLKSSALEDFFDFQFTSLPHKLYAYKQFIEEADLLKSQFYDALNDGFLLKSKYHKKIPADGFSIYAESIWEKVVSNKDLDLPTQQELLAQYRCDEIANACYEFFSTHIKSRKAKLDSGQVIEELGNDFQHGKLETLKLFDQDGSRYVKDVYQKKREEFVQKIHSTLNLLFVQQLRNLHKKCLGEFELAMKKANSSGTFMKILSDAKSKAISYFTRIAETSSLKETEWNVQEFIFQFKEDLEKDCQKRKASAINSVFNELKTGFLELLPEQLHYVLRTPEEALWTNFCKMYQNLYQDAAIDLAKKCKSFEMAIEDEEELKEQLKTVGAEKLKKVLNEELKESAMVVKLKHKFETVFKYDQHGVPRVWKPEDDIDLVFRNAMDECEKCLYLYAQLNVTDSGLLDLCRFNLKDSILIAPNKLDAIRTLFKREANVIFVEAKRSTVATNVKIPGWFIVLTIFLGWNEFMAVLRNPLYFSLMAIAMSVAYAIWYLGMAPAVVSVSKAAVSEASSQIYEKLKERGVPVDKIVDGTFLNEAIAATSQAIQSNSAERKEEIEHSPIELKDFNCKESE